MKTLNKTLCLVLALVMVLGLFGVASATSFKDDTDIQYKTAVDVMTAVGAINGYEDGTFAPKGNVTRAEAAKLVVYSILGADIAKTLTSSTSSFTDIPAGNWASGSVEYLVSKGVINGRGDGTFDPNGKVTSYEIAKMMLIAAGYGKQGEYTGAQWQLNVAIDAAKCKIFEGTKETDFADAATREEAALYAFNGINVELVAYSKDKETYAPADAATDTENTTANTIATNVYPLLKKVALDAADNGGVAGTKWYIDTNKNGTFDATTDTLVGTYNTEAASASYTAGTTIADIAKAQGVKVGETSYTVNVYRNDVLKDTLTKTGNELYAMTDTVIPGGVTAEVVVPANTTNTFNLLYTIHYLAKLNSVTLDTTPDNGVDNRALSITIFGYGTNAGTAYAHTMTVTAEDYAGFDTIFAMVKDQTATTLAAKPIMVDVVPVGDSVTGTGTLQTAHKYTIKSVALPTTVDGKATAKDTTKNTITVAGKDYLVGHKLAQAYGAVNAVANGTVANFSTVNFTTDYTLVLDATGAVALIKVATATAVQGDVYYVTGTYDKPTATDFGTVVYTYAHVVDMAGTASSILIGVGATDEYTIAAGVNTLSAGMYTFATDTTANSKSSTLGFKKATGVSSTFGDINNTTVTVAATQVADGGVDVTEKSATIADSKVDASAKVYLTSSTKYIFAVGTGAALKLNTVTGGINFTIPADSYVVVTKDADGNYIATAVVITASEYTNAGVASDSVLYFTGAAPTTTKAYTDAAGAIQTGYVYTVYDATGAAKTITATNSTVEKGFWTYKVVNDIYTTAAELTSSNGAYEDAEYASKVGTQITTTTTVLTDVEAGSAKIVDLRTAAQKTASGVTTLATLADIAAAKAASKTITMDIFTTTTNNVQSVAIIFVTGPTE